MDAGAPARPAQWSALARRVVAGVLLGLLVAGVAAALVGLFAPGAVP